jgi:hypothetical protein
LVITIFSFWRKDKYIIAISVLTIILLFVVKIIYQIP